MREVLFRGKTPEGEWVEGLIGAVFTADENRKPILRDFIEIDCLGWTSHTYVYDETVGQYTGLTDKNGKKIFEGDIIQSLKSSVTGLVQWFPEHSAFMVWCKSANEVGFLYECADIIKVIGNIHDNPEMLKGGAE